MGEYSCHSLMSTILIASYSDLYAVIKDETILPPDHHLPAEYPPVGQRKLDRPSTIEDVCDFVIEYIDSDILVCPVSWCECSTHLSLMFRVYFPTGI